MSPPPLHAFTPLPPNIALFILSPFSLYSNWPLTLTPFAISSHLFHFLSYPFPISLLPHYSILHWNCIIKIRGSESPPSVEKKIRKKFWLPIREQKICRKGRKAKKNHQRKLLSETQIIWNTKIWISQSIYEISQKNLMGKKVKRFCKVRRYWLKTDDIRYIRIFNKKPIHKKSSAGYNFIDYKNPDISSNKFT